jgi:hypothetical protein
MAGGGQNRPADGLQLHLAASAYPGEVFLLFLVHGNRPFVRSVDGSNANRQLLYGKIALINLP